MKATGPAIYTHKPSKETIDSTLVARGVTSVLQSAHSSLPRELVHFMTAAWSDRVLAARPRALDPRRRP